MENNQQHFHPVANDSNTSTATPGNNPGPPAPTATTPFPNPFHDNECTTCGDPVPQDAGIRLHLTCNHLHHKACIERMFEVASRAPFSVARCCEAVTLDQVQDILPADLMARVRKTRRVALARDREVYCHVATCSKLLAGQRGERKRAKCEGCGAETCRECLAKGHEGTCSANPEFQGVLALAEKKGWRACPWCRRLVELAEGCLHIE